MQDRQKTSVHLERSLWLLVVMIFIMVVLGGITRLTGSGLSIVEWAPLSGILPPWGEGQWMAEFARYQASPEFLTVHPTMTLPEFKSIFWLEYIHRLWGRLLAFVLLIPTAIVFFKRAHRSLTPKILILWLLGAGQGVLGWYMVKSGLVQDPQVSPYRLAAHLLMGFAIFGVALSAALSLRLDNTSLGYSYRDLKSVQRLGQIGLGLLLMTVTMGAFVAGLKAGLIYNTFPKMGLTWVPSEIFFHSPLWINFTENATTVQFTHRILATLVLAYLLYFAYVSSKKRVPEDILKASMVLAGLVILQYTLGILTLIYQVPVLLGTLHQGCALLIFGTFVYMLFRTNLMRKS